jgi:hypothetical protein
MPHHNNGFGKIASRSTAVSRFKGAAISLVKLRIWQVGCHG